MTPQRAARARARSGFAHERHLATDLRAWLVRMYAIAADMVEHGQEKAALVVPQNHEGELLTRFAARLIVMAQDTVRLAFGHLQQLKSTGPKAADDAVTTYLRRYSVRRVKGIRKTTAKRIRKIIADGHKAGLKPAEIAAKMRKATRSKLIRARAESIAQTEIHQAQERAAYLTARKAGLRLVKTWASMEDDRVRPAHAAADGQTVPVDKPFTVGGFKMMFPGDSSAPPEQVINCRCVAVYSTAPLGLGLPRQWRPNRRPAVAEPVS